VDHRKIIEYIQDPSSLLYKADINAIEEVIRAYPFFSSAHILLAIAMNQKEGVFSNTHLHMAALYAGSRSKLHHYFSPAFSTKGRDLLKEIDRPKLKPKPIKRKSDSIIDKFIENKPSIQKPVSHFYNPIEKASESLVDDESFATETLAKIYTQQRRFEKAIKIYQKLSLINPEKSDYFALLIKHLEDKINE
jgi:tetratricopeptide (TPR) repeat protein